MSIQRLHALAHNHLCKPMVEPVLDDPRFERWSGSSKRKDGQKAHHYGVGGLAQHTLEVVEIALAANKALGKPVPEWQIVVAGIYHDVGKLDDYEEVDGEWVGTKHKKMCYHLTRSALVWNDYCRTFKVDPETTEEILHAILAHHGRLEYGSPVTPQTQLATLIHLADSISARMNDFDTLAR